MATGGATLKRSEQRGPAPAGREARPPRQPTERDLQRAERRAAKQEAKQKAKAEKAGKPRPLLLRWLPRRSLAVVHDVAGPKVRLGVLWFLANVAGLAVGLEVMAPLWAITAGVAGLQASRAWRKAGVRAHRAVGGGGAALIAVAAAVSVGFLGIAILVVTAASYYMALIDLKGGKPILQSSYTLQCALFPGLAAAGVLITLRFDLIAAAGLVLLVSAYESGDFLIGSGARWKWEGPLVGMVATMVMVFAISTLRLPPFVLPDSLWLGGLVAVLAPIGQLAGSALLPSAAARAPAVRRLDSMLVLAPVWAVVSGIMTGGS
jgi:hypothetical protein